MSSFPPTALFVLTLAMIATSIAWNIAVRRFLGLLRAEHLDTFRQLGSPSSWRVESSVTALQHTRRLYRFLVARSQDASTPELQTWCRHLRLLFVFRWGTVAVFVFALLLTAIVYPDAQNI